MMAELFVTMLSNPAGYIFNMPSSICNKSLKDGDLSQNPKVNFWHIGNIYLYKSLGLDINMEKNFTKEGEDKHFSKK